MGSEAGATESKLVISELKGNAPRRRDSGTRAPRADEAHLRPVPGNHTAPGRHAPRSAAMAEPRRVQLTTLPGGTTAAAAAAATTAGVGEPASLPNRIPRAPAALPDRGGTGSEAGTAAEPTVRFTVKLFDPDERAFPEFSYAELVDTKRARAVIKDGEETGAMDEVAAIARMFEEKYGGEKRRKTDRMQDLIDIGYGYDEEDSFIDNTEAYDEFVPASITTKLGGFYVNSGLLQFRQASDTDDVATESDALQAPKKRKLNDGHYTAKQQCKDVGQMKMTIDLKGFASEDRVEKPLKMKKKSPGPLSVTNMLKKFQREKERERQKKGRVKHVNNTTTTTNNPIPLCPADAAGGGPGLSDPILCLIGSTNDHALIQAATTVDFDVDLDSLLDATEETAEFECVKQETETNSSSLSQEQRPSEAKTTSVVELVPLPEGLPVELERKVGELKVAAGSFGVEFFTPDTNAIILAIESQCQELDAHVHASVYAHLGSHLPYSRRELLKHVYKLQHSHGGPLQKLKEAIDSVMPEQIARFHDNRQARSQVKLSKVTEEKAPNLGSEDDGEEKIGKRAPQKKFKWNEEIRECLRLVIRTKMDRFEIEKDENQEMEDYLKNFIDHEVKTLWPRGWMQPRVLLKESKKYLSQSSLNMMKKVKSEKKPSIICGAPNQQSGSSDVHVLPETQKGEAGLSSAVHSVPQEDVATNPCTQVTVGKDLGALERVEDTGAEGVGVESSLPSILEKDNKCLCDTVPVPALSTPTLLDLLAEQAIARGQLLLNDAITQKLMAAAISGKHSAKHWSLGGNFSPPLPPPPHSSPVTFPGNGVCNLPEPRIAEFSQQVVQNLTKMQAMSDGCTPNIPEACYHGFTQNGSSIIGEERDIGRN